MSVISFAATGDSFMTRRIPAEGYEGFIELAALIGRHDVKFNNLEITVHEQEGYPAASSGGTWAMTEPAMLGDLARFGFNIYNTANNHTGDYCHGGMLATIKNLRARDMLFAGTGKNLAEAAAPAYLETPKARVALIAACSTIHDADIAGNQGLHTEGRPGLNPLRYKKSFHVTKEYFDTLKAVAVETDMNAEEDLEIATGYQLPNPEGVLNFGGLAFVLDEKNEAHTEPKQKDLDRILKAVKEAKRQADYALVSLHTHEFAGKSLENTAEFIETTAHACIDAGADAVLGHGPHILRGIEIYKGKPIFYSLGNFLFETETVSLQPAEAYENAGMAPTTEVGEYMNARSLDGTRGFAVDKDIWRSVVATFVEDEGELKEIKLYPITLGMGEKRSRLGTPRLSGNEETLRHLARLSEPYGTKIEIKDGIGIIVPG